MRDQRSPICGSAASDQREEPRYRSRRSASVRRRGLYLCRAARCPRGSCKRTGRSVRSIAGSGGTVALATLSEKTIRNLAKSFWPNCRSLGGVSRPGRLNTASEAHMVSQTGHAVFPCPFGLEPPVDPIFPTVIVALISDTLYPRQHGRADHRSLRAEAKISQSVNPDHLRRKHTPGLRASFVIGIGVRSKSLIADRYISRSPL